MLEEREHLRRSSLAGQSRETQHESVRAPDVHPGGDAVRKREMQSEAQ